MKILLVEDDDDIRRALSLSLKADGHVFDVAEDGERGYLLASTNDYDLIILDYNLPRLSGREITQKIRQENINTPVLILTVRSEINDKVDLLNIGADDYLTKPFATSELLARIKAITRRPKIWQGHILKFRDIELDPDKFLVLKNHKRINLSTKEFALLEYLLRNRGQIMSRQKIIEHVWDENADPFSNTIEVHIRSLRRKLDDDRHKLIFTFSNRSYKIDEKK